MATQLTNTNSSRASGTRLRVPNPSSMAPRPSQGLSLTEVLISLGVLTIGLLGVAAIFPVGSANVQRADVTQRADSIAQAALNDAITRGLLDPERWVAYEDAANSAMGRGWGGYTSLATQATYSRPYAADFRRRLEFAAQRLAEPSNQQTAWDPVEVASRLNAVLGSVVVIDPTAVAAHTAVIDGADFDAPQQLAAFPSSANYASPPNLGVEFTLLPAVRMPGLRWAAWANSGMETLWPLQRVTVRQNSGIAQQVAAPVVFAEADRLATTGDDLAMELPEEDDQPAQTLFLAAGGQSLLRQARQEYSYLLTVAPTTYDSFLALANGGDGAYDVSAVVMNRRALGARGVNEPFNAASNPDLAEPTQLLEALQEGERLVRVSLQTPGPGASGGEVLMFRGGASGLTPFGKTGTLADAPNNNAADAWWTDWLADVSSPWSELRAGQWVFLFGPHPNSTGVRPLMFAQWYRVLSFNDETGENGNERARIRVQLRGPDWPWTNTSTLAQALDPMQAEDHLFAVIVPDVVAVHTRTLNLSSAQ